MNQYALKPLEHRMNTEPYREWPITEPTTRRVDLFLMPPKTVEAKRTEYGHVARLDLREEVNGDDFIEIATASLDEYFAITRTPRMKDTYTAWNSGVPRYGTWRYYLEVVALARYVFPVAGWTMTPDEAALFAALEEYGRQAPARYLRAVG